MSQLDGPNAQYGFDRVALPARPADPQDLRFGDGPRVVVVGGRREFRELPGPDPRRKAYLHGEWVGPGLEAAVRAGEFHDGFGRFVVLVHDLERRRLAVYTDRYGMAPLFETTSSDQIFLSTRIAPLLERGLARGSLDHAALSHSLAFHTPLGTRTLVSDISSLAPASCLVVDLESGEVRAERRWDPAAILVSAQEPYEAHRESLISSFLEGYERCTAGSKQTGITLSGGIDSRCLLAAGLSLGVPLSAFNASVPGSRSARYAERMAALTSTPYHAFGVGAEFAPEYGARLLGVIELTEGMTFSSEAEAHWLSEHVAGPDRMLHGAFAELSKLGKMHLYELSGPIAGARREDLAEVLWRRFEPAFRSSLSVLSAELRESLAKRARDELRADIGAIDDRASVPMVMQVLYIENFLSKVTRCSASVWNHRLVTRFPFSYSPLVDTLLRVRAEDKRTQRFQMDLLRRTAPELFAFPDANTGTRVDAPAWLQKGLGLLDKARTVVTARKTTLDHSDPLTWLGAMKPSAREILLDSRGDGVFDRAALERTLALVLGDSAPEPRGPIGAVRHRIRRHREADIIRKALQLQLWRQWSGVWSL